MYVSLYNAPMTLALEVFPYLVYNIMSVTQTFHWVVVESFLCIFMIFLIAKKNRFFINPRPAEFYGEDGDKLYGYLVAILG